MPYKMSTAGLNNLGRAHDMDNQSEAGRESSGMAKTKSKKKKIKSKGQKEERVLSEEAKMQLILQEIEEKAREQALSNLWPEPNTKIFIGTRAKSTATTKKPAPNTTRNGKLSQSKYNSQLISENSNIGYQLQVKLSQLKNSSTTSLR